MENSTLKYFTRLELENIKCFGTKQSLDLSDGNGNPTRWNLILGDNGVGKTTLLEFLAWMRPEPANDDAELIKRVDDENGISYIRLDPLTKLPKESELQEDKDEKKGREIIILVPALQNVEENSFFERLDKSFQLSLDLKAWVSQGKKLVDMQSQTEDSRQKNKKRIFQDEEIITGIQAIYFKEDDAENNKKGELFDLKREGNTEIENREEVGTDFESPFIVVYGANRYMGIKNANDPKLEDAITNRLIDCELYDAEEILQNLLFRANVFKGDEVARLNKFKDVVARILPGIKANGIHIYPPETTKESSNPSGVLFDTFSGQVPLSALSLGYQTTLAWTLDLAWRLYKNYPERKNPLNEPAIVLIDELDLHLHPKWQLQIMDNLSQKLMFPNVQFIATSHSPLLVQSSSTTNFAVIQKHDDEVVILNDPVVVKTWRIDQILISELFGLKTTRDKKTEKLFHEKYKLLDKQNPSENDKKRLEEINEEILQLPTLASPKGEQKAFDFIKRAADILKKHGVTLNDQD